MDFRQRRCRHCNSVYSYQISGEGCMSSLNDPIFCPGCAEVVAKALANVPVKYARRWVPRPDIPVTDVMILPAGMVRQVMVGAKVDHARHVKFPDREFRIITMDQKWGGQVTVEEEVEMDLITGQEVGPWRKIDGKS